ncbi:MAG: helix-turn-helix transcriptional regulator [Haloferacaceae archaeon]
MWSAPRSLALLAVLVALLAPATVGVAVADASPGATPGDGDSTAVTPAFGSDAPAALGDPPGRPSLARPLNTTVRIDLHANASASWSVVVTYELDSDAERDAFEQYVEEYRNGETDAGPSADTFRAIAERAAAGTGREMRVTNVTRSGSVGETYGRVSLSFRWTAMLDRGGNRTLRLDDAVLLSGNRTWLSTIEADQRLVIATPPGYSIVDSSGPSFDIRNNAVVIEGPRTLDGPLSVTYQRTATTPTPPDGFGQLPLVGGAVLLVAALLVAVFLWRGGGRPAPVSSNGGPDAGGAAAEGTEPATPEAADGTAPADAGSGTDTEAAEEEPADEVDLDLLSDEERVEHLLERNEGRMKQADIVSETGWSDAKVSQLLSAMADEGRVEKLRLGRENLISLPEEAPDEDG